MWLIVADCGFKEVFSLRHLNDTHVVLILKMVSLDSIRDFQSIALCNVLYKILTKVLANRLKRVLNSIIFTSQPTFVPERFIQDNVLVAFELLQGMKRERLGGEGPVALKIDISKTYDRVR